MVMTFEELYSIYEEEMKPFMDSTEDTKMDLYLKGKKNFYNRTGLDENSWGTMLDKFLYNNQQSKK